jgi:predicted ATPase
MHRVPRKLGNQMDKLKRLKVQGFRSIRDQTVEFSDLTVLIGANGAGKSNLIALFNMLNFILSESLQIYVGRKGGGSSILHYGQKKTPTMSVDLEFEGKSVSHYGFVLAFAAPDRVLFTDEYVTFQRPQEASPFSRNLGVGQLETNLLMLSRNVDDRVARDVALQFVKRLRELQVYHFHDTSDEAHIRGGQQLDRNRFLMSTGGNLASFLYMLQTSRPEHFQRIVESIRVAIPFLKEFHLEPNRLDPSTILLRWRDRNPDYEFGPHQLSDGSLRAIALITALLQPEEFMPGLMLIDEPELGLHPSAIGLVASLIQAAAQKRQVVVATQSSRFLDEFAPKDVVVVEREEDDRGYGESVFRRLSKAELGDWLNDYDLGTLYEMQVTGGGPQ